MSSRARGIRARDRQWIPLEEAWTDLRERYPKISFNDFLWIMLELGLTFYRTLPFSTQAKLWKPDKTFPQQQRLRVEVEQRAQKLAESSKMDAFIVFRVPAEKKRLLRSRAENAKMDVSKFIRSRILEEKED